jgi:hypothetical protein
MGNAMMHSQRCIFDADVMPLAHLGAVPVPALHFAAPFTNSIWQGCKHMKKKFLGHQYLMYLGTISDLRQQGLR